MKLEKLDWDSAFFELNIGKAFVTNVMDLKSLEDINAASFNLIYLFSNQPLPQLTAIDERVELERKIDVSENYVAEDILIWKGNTTKELLELAISSGHQSRFKKDLKLANKFELLYKMWIEKSVNGTLADYVLVAQQNSKIVGMLTLKLKENFSEIGLVAVSLQGQGIGNKLMQKAFQLTKTHHKKLIKVVTQKENKGAMLFYEKNGFYVKKIDYVYHYWQNVTSFNNKNNF